jgi:serine phosphatase RsbU (regulator of sigma subunit)
VNRPRRLDLRFLLTRAEAAAPVGVVGAIGSALAEMLDAREVRFLIADFSGRSLTRLHHVVASETPGPRTLETSERVELEGTPYGAAPAGQRSVVLHEGENTRVLAPVTSRGEAVGVLELILPFEPARITLEDLELAAHQLAYMIIANRRYTDLFEWGQRTVPLSLAAEIQRRLLPASFTCEADQFTVAAWLEPAGEVGGDTFDFSLDRDALHLSMTDAMGHSVESALLATLVVGALRNTRRRGMTLIEQAQEANQALMSYATHGGFVTGQLVRIDLVAQTAHVLNAGHPRPIRLRQGRAEEIDLTANQPFGAVAEARWDEQAMSLEPGDRVLFLTDGMLERKAGGVDIPHLMLATAPLHPREAIQHLTHAVLESVGGELRDDATSLCFDWH